MSHIINMHSHIVCTSDQLLLNYYPLDSGNIFKLNNHTTPYHALQHHITPIYLFKVGYKHSCSVLRGKLSIPKNYVQLRYLQGKQVKFKC